MVQVVDGTETPEPAAATEPKPRAKRVKKAEPAPATDSSKKHKRSQARYDKLTRWLGRYGDKSVAEFHSNKRGDPVIVLMIKEEVR